MLFDVGTASILAAKLPQTDFTSLIAALMSICFFMGIVFFSLALLLRCLMSQR